MSICRLIVHALYALLCLSFTIVLSMGTASAAESPWAENEGGRMRLVTLPPEEDGTIRALLQIEPKPGWITYWREPGESGIPPQISVKGDGIALKDVRYPAPKPILIGDIHEIGYDGPVGLPMTLSVKDKQTPDVSIETFIGLCKDICIPFQASLSASLNDKPTLAEQVAVSQAVNALPEAPSDGFKLLQASFSADGKTLSFSLRLPPAKIDPAVYVTGPSGTVLFNIRNGKRSGDVFSGEFAVSHLPKGYDPHGKTWQFLAVSGARSMETTLVLQ